MIYSDEYLDFWADVFVRHQAADYGYSLPQFLAAPKRSLRRIRLLRDQQREVDSILERIRAGQATTADAERLADIGGPRLERVELGTESLPRRNGCIVEPLKHRRWPHSCSSFRRR